MPDEMSNALTASSNCRSDSRLKMRNPAWAALVSEVRRFLREGAPSPSRLYLFFWPLTLRGARRH